MSFDNEITVAPERLRALGIVAPEQAQKNLELLQKSLGPEEYREILKPLLAALASSADPDMALNNLERFVSPQEAASVISAVRANPSLLSALITIFGASRFLSAFLMVDPDESLSLLTGPGFLVEPPGRERLAQRLTSMLASVSDDKHFFRILRLFRKQEMCRLALRDLLNKADLRETVDSLSDLAEVCLQKAYEWSEAALAARYGRPMITTEDGTRIPAGFSIIAMGKLGGRELNFSSDVDLMYVYRADGETEGVRQKDGTAGNKISNHQYFVKLAEKVTAAIGEKSEDGFVFRVDLRLRPEGQRGPLAQSLGGYEIYYESWGQTWERSALIKARPVAGDEAVGREFLERIAPFVYRKYLDYSAIGEIRDMKQKINKEVEQKGRTHRDVKLGYGGIREIEFVIQALQLIYAGRDRTLRERNALKALHLLSQKGLITYQEQSVFAKAYLFLRTVEHRIQILDDLQTQTMPLEEKEVRTLARRAGRLQQGREAGLLLRDYEEHTRAVRTIFDDLFGFTGEERAPDSIAGDYDLLLDRETPEQESVALFQRHGFRDPEKAYRNLILLREGAAFALQTPRSRKLFNDIFPALFHKTASSPDPDMALNHLESFLAAQGSWESLHSLLKLGPSAADVLIAVFANSEYFSRMLVSRPALLQNLLESRRAYGVGTYRVFERELSEMLDRVPDLTGKLDALRRFKHQEEIRIGMADLLSNIRLTEVSRDLSKLAEVCLNAALRLAFSEVSRRFHAPWRAARGLAVIGAGKLGGRELTYGSDLDILFVFSEPRVEARPADLSVFEYMSKVAEKTISYLSTLTREGFAFRIDTRLRPTGSKGPLVQSVDAFRSYYADQAQTWERQALLKARPVAGDLELGRMFCSEIENVIYRDDDRKALAEEVRTMRRRIEEEIGKEDGKSYNIKQGAGGIVDIEFIVQYVQLLQGKRHRRIRVPGTCNALRAIKRERLLPSDACDTLMQGYLFLHRIESRLRIVSNQSTSELRKDHNALLALARRMGYRNGDKPAGLQLLDQYRDISAQVRTLFQKVLTGFS